MNVTYCISPGGKLTGKIKVPGDKSISHRSIMLGAIAEGITEVSGFLEGEDALSTMNAFRAMGVRIDGPDLGRVTIYGVGKHGLTAPNQVIDCGNSGTTMRLLSGLLAGQGFEVTLTGDDTLLKRPMARVANPLKQMGALIETKDSGKPPLTIHPNSHLNGITYTLPMASAQVKSAVLLAGLYANGLTTVIEPEVTRDHTERMLEAFGYKPKVNGNSITVDNSAVLHGTSIRVPSDISSAAFFMVGAAISEGSDLIIEEVGINPTRDGVIKILELMGAEISLLNVNYVGGEKVADIHIKYKPLTGIHIPEELVSLAIDEFPVIFIAAANAKGTTILSGAEELRVKESDRIQVMADGLMSLGINAVPTSDGMIIEGGSYHGGTINSHGDHRIAMSFSIAALNATSSITILDCQNVATSFPGFDKLAKSTGLEISVS
ncbi:3-phosphoshikimate 1-carboxyvinyltransferase [Ferrovum sp. PN-J185]|uniref:3-phosphoshikimate 1-carboxyvinyltransferase n=1 Tax=Ferrovum sp. PN-J185 TaxID=1356306 RepID=UPI0007930288|nr:3-phosphoshikimate 1-carboxyvinyltransferase [Ferrovum sp. PN-J185]KXW56873.1 3-phosphoshikimate 1-carboxyvinyltransferase [Ferrovum sp. PN-J185]MCC6069259.1 3-phosphoshikimate 1-carboxyvinyltransferase [Ferrovum sp. PN-J185]